MRGSSDILAALDSHIAVDRKVDENFLVVTQPKLRQAEEVKAFRVDIIKGQGKNVRLEYGGEYKDKRNTKTELRTCIKDVLSKCENPISKNDLWELLQKTGIKAGRSTYKAVLEEMIRCYEVDTQKGPKNTILCTLANSSSEGDGVD